MAKFITKLKSNLYPYFFSFFILAILFLSFGKMAEFGIALNIIIPIIFILLFPILFIVELLSDLNKNKDIKMKTWFKTWFKSSNIIYGIITGGLIIVGFMIVFFWWYNLGEEKQVFFGREAWVQGSLLGGALLPFAFGMLGMQLFRKKLTNSFDSQGKSLDNESTPKVIKKEEKLIDTTNEKRRAVIKRADGSESKVFFFD